MPTQRAATMPWKTRPCASRANARWSSGTTGSREHLAAGWPHIGPACVPARSNSVSISSRANRGLGKLVEVSPQLKWDAALRCVGFRHVLSTTWQDAEPASRLAALSWCRLTCSRPVPADPPNIGREFRRRRADSNRGGAAAEGRPRHAGRSVAERFREAEADYCRAASAMS